MIDPALQELEGTSNMDDDHEPNRPGLSLSDHNQVTNQANQIDKEAAELQKEVDAHSEAIQEIHKKLVSRKSASTAFKNLSKNQIKSRSAKDRSSVTQRPHQPISGEVKRLIEKEVFENGKQQIEVAKTFGISD